MLNLDKEIGIKVNKCIITKNGKHLQIYIKKPFFKSFKELMFHYNNIFYDKENFLGIGIDKTRKYIILTFVLRNKEDILPYLSKKGE